MRPSTSCECTCPGGRELHSSRRYPEMCRDQRAISNPLDLSVQAVLKSPLDGTCDGSTPRSARSTAKRSPRRIPSSSRQGPFFRTVFG
jgi:hypothetical protein